MVTIFALCCAIGLQWLALQSIAWTTMVVDYSRNASLCQAIARTLDGAHPCSLCKIVNRGKTAQNKSDLQLPSQKIDMICPPRAIRHIESFVPFEYATERFCIAEAGHSPAVPPPRFTAV
jgi:hypothetical protein